MTSKKYFTVPNLLSLFRIILIPIFVVTYLNALKIPHSIPWIPILVLALSGLTDLFDGMIARKFNQVSDLGKMLDPAADKLTQAAVIACLVYHFQSPLMWTLLIVYVLKELLMVTGGFVMLRKKKQVPSARWYGKVSTFEMYTAIILLLVFPGMPMICVTALILLSIALVLFALVMYTILFFKS